MITVEDIEKAVCEEFKITSDILRLKKGESGYMGAEPKYLVMYIAMHHFKISSEVYKRYNLCRSENSRIHITIAGYLQTGLGKSRFDRIISRIVPTKNINPVYLKTWEILELQRKSRIKLR